MDKKIVIIGAGPAGLGAAFRLQELGYKNWRIYEKNNYVGGLSASFKDAQGFIWDIGGHILFSHYEYFNRLFERLLKCDYLEHSPRAYIWSRKKFVPYPFQNNIRYLPLDKIIECLLGLAKVKVNKSNPANFKEWIISTFGKGIAKYFMLPHNSKIWAFPLDEMSYAWTKERPVFSADGIRRHSNSRFKYPLYGGIGGLFEKFIPYINPNLALNRRVKKIDLKFAKIIFADGSEDNYDFLINTMPLNELILQAELNEFKPQLRRLKYNSVSVAGIGIRKKTAQNKCWVYFPDAKFPFHRITYLSNYSSYNTPQDDNYYSLLCETVYSEYRPLNKDKIMEDVIRGLIGAKILSESDRDYIASTYLTDVKYAYPIPVLDRDKILRNIQGYLEQRNIYSRGRFGSWVYETSSMDSCVMQGAITVDRILNIN